MLVEFKYDIFDEVRFIYERVEYQGAIFSQKRGHDGLSYEIMCNKPFQMFVANEDKIIERIEKKAE